MSKEKEVKIIPEFLGIHASNSFIAYDSASRSQMFGSHISQALVLDNGEEKIIQTGLEREFAKYTFSKKFKNESKILAVIPRYKNGMHKDSINATPEITVIYEDLVENTYDCLVIPYNSNLHSYFGFKYKWNTKLIESLTPGMIVPAGTVLADSPAVKENNGYGFGVSLNICSSSHLEVAEDGIIISKSALKKLNFKVYEKRVVSYGKNKVPLNLYGDENNYKPFPDIGDWVHSSGMLAALRENESYLAPVLFSKKAMLKINPLFDEAIYTRNPQGRVVDIKCYHNSISKKAPLTNTSEFARKYSKGLLEYHSDLLEVYGDLEKEMNAQTYNKPQFSPAFTNKIVESFSLVNSEVEDGQTTPIKKLYKKDELDIFRLEFTIEHEINVTTGFKLTNLHGKV